jgi:hypothetical protein
MWENICANKNINFHNYVIYIHNFGPKHVYDLQTQLIDVQHLNYWQG